VTATALIREHSRRLTREQWILLALLVVSVCINYVDRGSLSVGQGAITRELRIDPARLGMIFSAFFWTYASFQLISGWLVDRLPVNRVLAVAYLVWSVAMGLTGLATGLGSLLVLRLILGAGESAAYPSYSRILAGCFREEQRGFANALIDAGSKVGPAIGVLAGGLAMERFGWRWFFFGMGGFSLLWLVPWIWSAPKRTFERDYTDANIPSFARILRERSAWGTCVGLICTNYVWYFMVFWLPPYFENERHLSHHDMSILGSAPFWGVAFTSVCGGWISDSLIARGYSANVVRKSFIGAGLTLSILMLPAMLIRDNLVSLTLLTLACASYGLYSSNVWAVTQTLAGPCAAGKWTGIQNALGNVPGMVGLWFTGWVIQETGRYFMAFVIACLFLVIGALSFVLGVRRVEPIKW
jgi:ACS family D-galactonate transporter-like MFS transporter